MHLSKILIASMLTSAARAFSVPARALTQRTLPSVTFGVRSMSSTTGESETSIVDICKEKIVKALETDDVTVTGTCSCYWIGVHSVSSCATRMYL